MQISLTCIDASFAGNGNIYAAVVVYHFALLLVCCAIYLAECLFIGTFGARCWQSFGLAGVA